MYIESTKKRMKAALVEAFGHKCAICGLVDDPAVYDFHHLDPSKKETRISIMKQSDEELVLKEVKKCVMVCSNCHRKIHSIKNFIPQFSNISFNEQIYHNKYYEFSPPLAKIYSKIENNEFDIPINRENLKMLIREEPFTKIGERYGVSDNAVRKWCKKFNLPFQKKVIKTFSQEEWNNI